MKKALLFFICCIIYHSQAFARTYYVDFDSGNDRASGTATSAPWKHCPGDVNSTGNAALISLTGEDKVIFKGGVHYKGKVIVSNGRSDNSRVIYDGNSAAAWGAGKAVINGENINNDSRRYAFYANNKKYFTIINFEILYMGGYQNLSAYACPPNSPPLPDNAGYGVYMTNGTSFATVQDCYMHEIGPWQNSAPVIDDGYMSGFGVKITSGDHIVITGNEMTKVAHPVQLDAYNSKPLSITNITIRNNNFHHYLRWLVSMKIDADNATMNNVDIFNNTFHDFPEYDKGMWSGCASNPHTNAIIFVIGGNPEYKNASLGTTKSPIKIHDNTFYQSASSGNGGTAMIFSSNWGGTLLIYNNTFVNVRHAGEGAIYVQDGTRAAANNPPLDYHIYNNSFYDNTYSVFLRSLSAGYELNREGNIIKIKNNIFYKTNSDAAFSVVIYDKTSSPTELDYNLYYTMRSDRTIISWRGAGGNLNLSGARSTWGFEKHGKYGDPLYTNITFGIGSNSGSNDLHVNPSSPALSTGKNLSEFFTTDKDDIIRPSSGLWTIGAYENTR